MCCELCEIRFYFYLFWFSNDRNPKPKWYCNMAMDSKIMSSTNVAYEMASSSKLFVVYSNKLKVFSDWHVRNTPCMLKLFRWIKLGSFQLNCFGLHKYLINFRFSHIGVQIKIKTHKWSYDFISSNSKVRSINIQFWLVHACDIYIYILKDILMSTNVYIYI